MQMGPIVLGVFLFVVIGSALFQILNVGGRGQSNIYDNAITFILFNFFF